MTGHWFGDHSRVVRVCPWGELEEDEATPGIGAFYPKVKKNGKVEKALSTNWLEFFGSVPVKEGLSKIKQTKTTYSIGPKAMLAVLEVSAVKHAASRAGVDLIATHDGDEKDPSHCSLSGYDPVDRRRQWKMANEIYAVLRPDDVYPVPT